MGLLLICLVAAALRIPTLARDSLWGDESLSVTIARMPVIDLIPHVRWWEQIPPLHHLLLRYWMLCCGDSERAVRMPSALAGVAAVWALGILVARLLGRRIGLIAALLLAVNPMHIAYSQECRAYALSVLLGLISCDLFIHLLRKPTRQLHVLYIAISALLLYTHIFGIFAIAAQAMYYAWRWATAWRRRLREESQDRGSRMEDGTSRTGDPPSSILHPRSPVLPLPFTHFIGDNLAIALLFAPWAPTVLLWTRMVSVSFWVKRATLDDITKTYWFFAGSVSALLLMTALIVIALARWRRRGRLDRISLFALLMLVPVIVPDVIAVLTRPSYAPRYAIMAVTGFCAVAAAGIAALKPAPLRRIALMALVLLCPLGAAPKVPKADWRAPAAFLEKNMRAGDLAVIHLKAGTRQYDYYVRRPDVPRRGVDGTSLPVSLPLDPPSRHIWLIVFEPWWPANAFLSRHDWKIERRFLNRHVLIMELVEPPPPPPPPPPSAE